MGAKRELGELIKTPRRNAFTSSARIQSYYTYWLLQCAAHAMNAFGEEQLALINFIRVPNALSHSAANNRRRARSPWIKTPQCLASFKPGRGKKRSPPRRLESSSSLQVWECECVRARVLSPYKRLLLPRIRSDINLSTFAVLERKPEALKVKAPWGSSMAACGEQRLL